MQFSRPGKSIDIGFIGSFNGSLGDECQNVRWIADLTDAKQKLQAWGREYIESRHYGFLDELSPLKYKARFADQRSDTH
jgi:putative transposase